LLQSGLYADDYVGMLQCSNYKRAGKGPGIVTYKKGRLDAMKKWH